MALKYFFKTTLCWSWTFLTIQIITTSTQAFSIPPLRLLHHSPTISTSSSLVRKTSPHFPYLTTPIITSSSRNQYKFPSAKLATSSNNNSNEEVVSNKLDEILSTLTSAFPFFVLFSALLGAYAPSTLTWVSSGSNSNLIPLMLSSVMMGTGMTLEKKDFTNVISQNFISVPMGILCQFLIMPFSAYLVGHLCFLLPGISPLLQSSMGNASASASASATSTAAALYLGLVLVGCSPGGTASNLVSLIAGADLALSVLLTACSTIMASFLTPVLVQLLLKYTLPQSIFHAAGTGTGTGMANVNVNVQVSGWTLCVATAKVVLGPVLLGMIINQKFPNVSKSISRFTPFASVLLVALICGGVVAQNVASMAASATSSSSSSMSLIPLILKSTILLHTIGFTVGYLVPKALLYVRDGNRKKKENVDMDDATTTTAAMERERTSRTVSIETGMQNSALAVVLARSIGADPLASLPGALSATVHSCLGSILAAYWRFKDGRKNK